MRACRVHNLYAVRRQDGGKERWQRRWRKTMRFSTFRRKTPQDLEIGYGTWGETAMFHRALQFSALGIPVDGGALSKMGKTGVQVETSIRIAVLAIVWSWSCESSKWRVVQAIG